MRGGAMNYEEYLAHDATLTDELILVDGLDRAIGSASKWQAHVDGALHRAFSVVLVHEGEGGPELLLAKRSLFKYHSGGLWANSCCSHPRVGEEIIDAAYRRVQEELGCTASALHEIAAFVYRAEFDNGLCEYEYDHVLLAHVGGEISPDPSEVGGVRWINLDDLAFELAEQPQQFAAWAPMVLTMSMSELRRA